MAKTRIDFNLSLSVIFLKGGKRFVAYSPALDLSTSGKTYEETKKRFVEVAALFLQEIHRRDTADAVLEELGWQKVKKEWRPPVVVGQASELIPISI